ncbi:probable G-protein coupled receptor B0563.6 [Macrobrachium nipponense]|uniref:probable G-protein coupled receptor B0563.6 n=1 Tax=Macrobrachium nipponense TaxID=159736 RepID=UPI0030C85555
MPGQCFCLHPKCICLFMVNISQSKLHPLVEFCRSTKEMETPLVVLFALAVIANVVNVAVLSHLHLSGPKRAVTSARGYLLSLAVSHCMIAAAGIARQSLPRDYQGLGAWAAFMLYEEIVFVALNFCGVILILGLSVDRYVAVCHPHRYVPADSHERMKTFIAVAYVLPAILYVPHFFYEVPQHGADDVWFMKPHTSLQKIVWNIWVIALQLIHNVIPCLLIVAFHGRILYCVVRLGHTRDSMTTGSRGPAGHQREKRIIYLLLALTLNFLVTSIPGALFRGVYTWLGDFCYFNPDHETVMKACWSLEVVGYASDSVLYFAMDGEYRDAFCFLLDKLCRRIKAQGTSGSV